MTKRKKKLKVQIRKTPSMIYLAIRRVEPILSSSKWGETPVNNFEMKRKSSKNREKENDHFVTRSNNFYNFMDHAK